MHRLPLSLAALALLATSLTGCCCSHLCGGGGYGAGYAPACPSPCGPCGQAYGATYGAAPTAMAPVGGGGCPTGNCGMYPSGAYYGPSASVGAMPGGYATASLPMDTMPTF